MPLLVLLLLIPRTSEHRRCAAKGPRVRSVTKRVIAIALGSCGCGRIRLLLPHHLQHPLFHLFCRRFHLMGANHPGVTVRTGEAPMLFAFRFPIASFSGPSIRVVPRSVSSA